MILVQRTTPCLRIPSGNFEWERNPFKLARSQLDELGNSSLEISAALDFKAPSMLIKMNFSRLRKSWHAEDAALSSAR
jgi:hypothetical protein